jgi:hypothetical protein
MAKTPMGGDVAKLARLRRPPTYPTDNTKVSYYHHIHLKE